MSTINKSLFTVALNLLLIAWGGAYSTSISALPITWTLHDVTFSDGGTASGEFTINQSGFLSGSSITTTAVGSFTAESYIYPGNSINPNFDYPSPNTFQITFQIDYTHALSLDFLYTVDLSNPQINPLNLISSFECEGSYSCYTGNAANIIASGGIIRSVTSGVAMTPEPTALSLLVIGVAGAGAFVRMRPKKQWIN